MAAPAPTDHLISQGRALVRAIEVLGTIEPTGPFERMLAWLLLTVYRRWLRAIVATIPASASEGKSSASEGVEEQSWAASVRGSVRKYLERHSNRQLVLAGGGANQPKEEALWQVDTLCVPVAGISE